MRRRTPHAWPVRIARARARVPAERASASEEPGPRGYAAKSMDLKRAVVSPTSPRKSGLPDLRRLTADLGQARDRCLAALARDTRDRRLANEPLAVVSTNDVKQRSCSSFPRRVSAPGFVFVSSHPTQRGAGGAPTGALMLLSRLRGATSALSEARRVP